MAMTKPLSILLWETLKSEFPNSSKNLAKFSRGRKYIKSHYRMYKDANGDFHLGFINETNCFCGRNLISLACGYTETFSYRIESPEDVTEWFIDEYKSKGMCTYTDMRHVWNVEDGHVGSSRFCIYCKKTETKRSEMVERIWWE